MRMIKKNLISRTTELLHERDARKTIPAAKTKLHIHDEEGNQSTFVVKCERKGYLLNEQDVSAVFDALVDAAIEAVRRGDTISITGLGSIGPHYRAARSFPNLDGTRCMSKEHLVVRYQPGQDIKMALKMYENTLNGDLSGFRTSRSAKAEEEEDGD